MFRNNQSGFTLIEVVVAMGVMAIGLLPLAMLQGHFAEGNARSRQLVHATDIAVGKIEQLSLIPDWGHADLQEGSHAPELPIRDHLLDYFLEWEVEDEGDHLVIDLTVRWKAGGQERNLDVHWIKGL